MVIEEPAALERFRPVGTDEGGTVLVAPIASHPTWRQAEGHGVPIGVISTNKPVEMSYAHPSMALLLRPDRFHDLIDICDEEPFLDVWRAMDRR